MVKVGNQVRIYVLIVLIIAILLVVSYYHAQENETLSDILSFFEGDIIEFSHPLGFYDSQICLSLQIPEGIPDNAVIYYTINGDDPDADSAIYENPIPLDPVENMVAFYPVKARLFYNGEFSDDIIENTYVIGFGVFDAYDLNVISITTDSDNLYNYYTGIMVNGYVYDQKVAAGRTGFIRGNQGEGWIRDAHVVMFDSKGNVQINQDIGFGIVGQSSAMSSVKSLKIIADELYDAENPKFEFDCYYDNYTSAPLSMVETYNSLKLRGGSQDYDLGNIRSSLASRLCEQSGFAGYSESERAIVYLNGSLYGVCDIQPRFTGSYFSDRFDLDDSQAIYDGDDVNKNESEILEHTGIDKFFKTDLNIAENREQLEQVVDMDNFLLYYAIESLLNNIDWPQSNFNMWKYLGEPDHNNPYTDGRFRFLIDDVDLIYFSKSFSQETEDIGEDILAAMLNSKYRAANSVFPNVMRSDVYRNQFVTIVCDLLNSSFKTENILQIIDEEYAKIRNASKLFWGTQIVEEVIDKRIEIMKQEVMKRESVVRSVFEQYWGLKEQYTFSLSTSEGIQASWGNTKLFGAENFSNMYYLDTEIVISQKAYPGYTFSHWLVNGKQVFSDSLVITNEDIVNGTVQIRAVGAKNADGDLIVSELFAKGASDWIKLMAVGKAPVLLSDYYLSDSEKLQKYQLPEITLLPGESIIIHGKHDSYKLGDYLCNFSLNNMETLRLYNAASGIIVDEVTIPKMEENETYGRYQNGPQFVFFKNNNNERKVSTY